MHPRKPGEVNARMLYLDTLLTDNILKSTSFRFLNPKPMSNTKTPTADADANNTGFTGISWRDRTDLSLITDKQVKTEIYDMLEKHASTTDEKLGTIKATKHRIDLEPGTRVIRSMPH